MGRIWCDLCALGNLQPLLKVPVDFALELLNFDPTPLGRLALGDCEPRYPSIGLCPAFELSAVARRLCTDPPEGRW